MIATRNLCLIAIPLALAACAPPPPSPPNVEVLIVDETPAPTADDSCGAAAYQQYIGQTSPQISLPSGSVFRDYRTGDPVTMDLNPSRLNFEYDRTGKLVKVSCG
ncbi:I78 family peptidase inhibitor [Paracoccus tegillarcae]|uniref:Peptidase inhibitor I78 family protein n=1 Tax=Paracoccus tegillarcae TaxID=1529068 RepID=A0A2K9EL34_9RHOB|nr:I78 family peptidase inhibitor [Paracoccus tegillarcae]AUH32305.1 hypothetical protein CUV01_01860 [Paracoccus tegillarcae]